MIDLHSHILHGLDDGPAGLEGSVEIARAAVEDGIEVVAATPHVRDDFPTSPEQMESGVAELRGRLRAAGIPLELRTGAEIAFDRVDGLSDHELQRFGLGGNPRFLLLETPSYGWPASAAELLFRLAARGFAVVLAHPERNGDIQARPELLRPLVDGGLLVQLTAASLDGRLGRAPRAAALKLLDLRLAHLLASDAHAPAIRAVGMRAASEAVGDEEIARWLTVKVPGAILADEPVPDRSVRRRHRLRLRHR